MASAFRRAVTVFISAELSPAARSARLAAYAAQATAQLIAEGRASPRYREFVDGVEGASPLNVRRVIADEFAYVGDAAAFALDFLRRQSPVKSGKFQDAFMLAVDGSPVRPGTFDPTRVPPGVSVTIYNRSPQTRKIDVQIAGGKTLHFSVPSGLFDSAAQAVKSRYGNSVTVSRVYNVNFPGQYVLKQGNNAGTPVQSPALIIAPLT